MKILVIALIFMFFGALGQDLQFECILCAGKFSSFFAFVFVVIIE
jgi:hypothetical protein